MQRHTKTKIQNGKWNPLPDPNPSPQNQLKILSICLHEKIIRIHISLYLHIFSSKAILPYTLFPVFLFHVPFICGDVSLIVCIHQSILFSKNQSFCNRMVHPSTKFVCIWRSLSLMCKNLSLGTYNTTLYWTFGENS